MKIEHTKGKFNMNETCSLKEAASMLGIDYQTAQNMVRRGTIKTFSYGRGMRPRVLLSSVRELIEKSGNR